MTQDNSSVFNRLGREMRRDLVIGGFIACFMAICALFSWGIYNQHKVNTCNERFTNFAIDLETRANQRAQQKEQESDSLKSAILIEVRQLQRDKAEVEAKLENIQNK